MGKWSDKVYRYRPGQLYRYVAEAKLGSGGLPLRTYFNPIQWSPVALPDNQALLLERILRFNYLIQNGQYAPGDGKF